ncbi:MAG: FAD-dependent oxidoreductase, partial [Armatimonadota bacterium]
MKNKFDVIVVGGGMAGVSAAIASARNGAKTLLIEHYGFLGGWASAALVNPFMSHTTSDNKPLIAGIFEEILQSLSEKNGLLENCFDPEILKVVLDEMVIKSGAEIRFHTTVVDAKSLDSDRKSIQTYSKNGFEDWECNILIDATGDGDVCVKLGADFESGDINGNPQSATYMFDMGGVDIKKALDYIKNNPDEMRFPKLDKNSDIEKLSN